MTFKPALASENYPRRWLSESGVWEVGLAEMMFGVRVQVARVGAIGPTLNYCAGPSPDAIWSLCYTVLLALEAFPETIGEAELRAAFPDYTVKPVLFCPLCWPRLQEMAHASIAAGLSRSKRSA